LTLLALKLLLGPALVAVASVATRRFGARVGGVVAGLPAITGPILVVLALDHGRSFAADAATASLLAMVGLLAFVVAYAAASSRVSWQTSLGASYLVSAGVTAALVPVEVGPYGALLISGGATALTLACLPRPAATVLQTESRPRWDLALRAGCTLVPILAVTGAAAALGPHLSGLLAGFPVIAPVLVAFTHAQAGATEAARLLHGLVLGFVAYGAFCFTISIALEGLGAAASFSVAVAVALVVQAAILVLSQARPEELVVAEGGDGQPATSTYTRR